MYHPKTEASIKPHIDCSKVPLGVQTLDIFKSFLARFRDDLSKPEFIRAVCIHETAHYLFLGRAGRADIRVTGPEIVFEDGKLKAYTAKVTPYGNNQSVLEKMNVAQGITATAQAFAAGGIAVEELTGSPYSGDDEDWENFKRWYNTVEGRFAVESPEDAWKKIKDSVRKLLKKPRWRETILDGVDAMKEEIFNSKPTTPCAAPLSEFLSNPS